MIDFIFSFFTSVADVCADVLVTLQLNLTLGVLAIVGL